MLLTHSVSIMQIETERLSIVSAHHAHEESLHPVQVPIIDGSHITSKQCPSSPIEVVSSRDDLIAFI